MRYIPLSLGSHGFSDSHKGMVGNRVYDIMPTSYTYSTEHIFNYNFGYTFGIWCHAEGVLLLCVFLSLQALNFGTFFPN